MSKKELTLEKCRDLMRLQHKSINTEKVYLLWISKYIDFLVESGKQLPDSKARIEAFLTSLAHRGVAAATQNQAFNAILYLYEQVRKEKVGDIRALRAKRPSHQRQALSRSDTMRLLDAVEDRAGYPVRLVVNLLYGCGLRVSEPLNLRIKDVDVSASRLTIRGAKGGKDRVVRVPCKLMAGLVSQIERAKIQWGLDRKNHLPVEVPGELARKYPGAPFSWQWYWVFPSHQSCKHPRTGETVKWRVHESNVQRAVKEAAGKVGLDYLATPHVLRHCYATHVLDRGANIRDLQEALGHFNLETTMGYVHAHAERIVSPLE
jgi:integron integrase